MDQNFQKVLWATADKPRSSMDVAGYKHLVLGHMSVDFKGDQKSRFSVGDGQDMHRKFVFPMHDALGMYSKGQFSVHVPGALE